MFTKNLITSRIISLSILTSVMLVSFSSALSQVQTKPLEKEIKPLPLEVLKEFTDAYGRIKSDYVEVIDDETILRNAIKGMLSGLDPHSAYLDQQGFVQIR